VPPQMIIDSPFSTPSQKYAIISALAVLDFTRCTGVKGFSLNRLMVKVEPLVVTSRAYVACIRCPSGDVPSRMGLETDICLPDLWPRATT